jgi:hypothetical protein
MFDSHIETSVNKSKRMMGQIFRVFKSRDAKIMIPLFKALVLPVIEYCSVLTSPYKLEEINQLEQVQRYFTTRINGMQGFDYWERLQVLNLYSLERRRERYIIIYTWKIIENLVPNLETDPILIKNQQNHRRGRWLEIPTLKAKQGTVLTIKESSLAVRGPKLFNSLSKDLRNLTGVSPVKFKKELDKYLQTVLDQPRVSGYAQYSKESSNSIRLQKRSTGGRGNTSRSLQ